MGLNDLDHVGRRCLFQKRGGGAEPERKNCQAAKAERKRQRWRAYEDVVGGDFEDFGGIPIGDDQQVAVKMHGGLGLPRGARGKAQQRHIIAAHRWRDEAYRFRQSDAVQFSIMVGGAVKADDGFQGAAGFANYNNSMQSLELAKKTRADNQPVESQKLRLQQQIELKEQEEKIRKLQEQLQQEKLSYQQLGTNLQALRQRALVTPSPIATATTTSNQPVLLDITAAASGNVVELPVNAGEIGRAHV